MMILGLKRKSRKDPKYLKLDDNENTVSQNMYDSVKVVLKTATFKNMLVKA